MLYGNFFVLDMLHVNLISIFLLVVYSFFFLSFLDDFFDDFFDDFLDDCNDGCKNVLDFC